TPQRHLLLLMIKGAPDGSECATVTDLVERMELAQSTVTELVQRAEEVGLIRREGSESDRRVARLRLTDEGEQPLASAFPAEEDERRRLGELVVGLDDSHPATRTGSGEKAT